MTSRSDSKARSLRRWPLRVLISMLIVAAAVPLSAWLYLRGSLAALDGTVRVAGLRAAVTATRDANGVPTVRGDDRLDVAYATGYLHAQDRFFQMDLLRRVAAGELAELFGPQALPIDREHRFHRFRARAEGVLKRAPAEDRALVDRYVAGVNDGLAALTTRPFEYALLQTTPQPWRDTDVVLVVWAMYFDLQDNLQSRELARGYLKEHLTPEQLAFLLPTASAYDAPIDAPSIDEPLAPIPASAPSLLGRGSLSQVPPPRPLRFAVGSNNWAIAGSRSETGGAIVANDMHLGIRLPHIWYRMVFDLPGEGTSRRRVVGVSLPGTPAITVGSNGHVAWGFTNSYGDYLDLVELERDPKSPLRVKTPAGWESLTQHVETLHVKGAPDETLTISETSLGPLWEVGGRAYAVHWIAHEDGAVNLELRKLEAANDLAAAQAIGNRAGMPAQNMVAGDSAGHIGWTIAGPLPNRSGSERATFPYAASEAALHWRGLKSPTEYPRVLDPPGGQLWTANARQLAVANNGGLGDGGADFGIRAKQIRDDLTALGSGKTDEGAVYRIGLDDRAVFLTPWRERALKALDAAALAEHPQRAEFRRLLESSWDGHASVGSVGYRLTREFLNALYQELFSGLDAELGRLAAHLDFDTASSRWPAVVERLLDEKPAAWLPPGRADWHAVELHAIDAVIAKLTKSGQPLAAATWGARNTARIAHPFASILTFLKPWLSAPADPLPGDQDMPRVASPTGGQSERLSVSPGREERGIFNMPGGQSGHPLSPYFLAGHAAWVKGEPTPLLPGPAEHTLTFVPR